MAKMLELAVQLSCVMNGNFDDRFTKAAKQLDGFREKIKNLGSLNNIANNYQTLSSRINNNNVVIAQNKKQLDTIGAAYSVLKTRQQQLQKLQDTLPARSRNTSEYAQELKKLEREMNNLSREQSRLESQNRQLGSQVQQDTQKFNQAGEALRRAGIDTNNLAKSQDNLQRELTETRQASDRLTEARTRLNAARVNLSWGNIKGDLMAAYAGIQAWKAPLNVSIDFEAALARVKSAGIKQFRDNPELVEALRRQAIQLGRDTKFTSSEAALAQEQLIRAGYSAQEVLNAMPGLLNLAASEDLQIDQAAEIIAKISKAFGYDASQTTRIADVLNNMSVSASTNVPQLYEGIRQVAPLAAKAGMQIEDLAAYIATMQDSAIDPSTSGNALKTGLIRLLSAANKVQGEDKEQKQATLKALQQLGVTIMTRDGKIRRMEDILAEMQKKLSSKGEGERLALLGDIFGKQNVTAWTALMADSFTGKTSQFVKSNNTEARGISEERAQILLQTTKGQSEIMGSAWQNLLLRIGDNLKPVVDITQKTATNIFSKLSEWSDRFPAASKTVTYTGAAMSTYGGFKLVPKIFEFVRAKIGLASAEAAAGQSLTSAGAAAGEAITAGAGGASQAITAGGSTFLSIVTTAANIFSGVLLGAAILFRKDVPVVPMGPGARDVDWKKIQQNYNKPQQPPQDFYQRLSNPANYAPKHALGGIFTTPHLGLVAEAGAEAIIPLTDKTRGTGLLIQAAEKLGLIHESSNTSSINNNNLTRSFTETNNIINREIMNRELNQERGIFSGGDSTTNINYVNGGTNRDNKQFAPVINISVNASETESRDNNSLGELIADKVRSVLDEINNNFMRLEYA